MGHALCGVATCVLALGAALSVPAAAAAMPRSDHIFVIIEENHTAGEIIGNPAAPVLNRLAQTYGYASKFYAERHPSEPNYIALVGGNTFGIRDNDAFYCKPHANASGCSNASRKASRT
jgi:hypothetical protein